MASEEFTTEGTECMVHIRGFLSVISVASVVNHFSATGGKADCRREIR